MSRFFSHRFDSLTAYTPGEQPQDRQFIKLNTNESPFDPSPKVIEAISSDEVSKLRLYSDPECRDLVKKAAKILEGDFDIEVVEKHHNQKIDAPSGTALMIADAMTEVLNNKPEYVYDRHAVRKKRGADEIGIHAVRGGTIVGEHEVIFAGTDEIIEIKHTAMSKEVFAVGAIRAAKFIAGKEPGMYCMQNML